MSKEEKPLKDKSLCSGCRENFYNGNNPYGIKECWSFKKSKVVKRWAIGWWTPMDKSSNFTECWKLSCYKQPGRTAFLEKLPRHL